MLARSVSPFALEMLLGPRVDGVVLGRGHLLVRDLVVTLTPPRVLRMPNGIESELSAPGPGARVSIGDGRLLTDAGTLEPGPVWDPKPVLRTYIRTNPVLSWPSLRRFVGLGPGLTPLGDDLIAGYLAGMALIAGDSARATSLAESIAPRTTALSATLLRLAARGDVPEAAHSLLEDGDPEPLLSWGATSGSGFLAGLGLHVKACHDPFDSNLAIELQLDRIHRFDVQVSVRRHSETPRPGLRTSASGGSQPSSTVSVIPAGCRLASSPPTSRS
jgi:Protein of unknown function (DUF2877)